MTQSWMTWKLTSERDQSFQLASLGRSESGCGKYEQLTMNETSVRTVDSNLRVITRRTDTIPYG